MDLDAIKKRLDALQASIKKNAYLWKPESGANTIRMVPYQHVKEKPFIEMYFYYNLGMKTYLSNHTFGGSDPIMEFSEKLNQTGDKYDWILSKKFEPKLRTFVPIIVRGKEKGGVKFWGFGKELYQELLSIIADSDYGDITDLSHGRDVVVVYQTPKEANNTYGRISMRVKPNQSRATNDKEVAKMIMNNQPNMDDVYKKYTYEELNKVLNSWLNPEDEDEPSDSITESFCLLIDLLKGAKLSRG